MAFSYNSADCNRVLIFNPISTKFGGGTRPDGGGGDPADRTRTSSSEHPEAKSKKTPLKCAGFLLIIFYLSLKTITMKGKTSKNSL